MTITPLDCLQCGTEYTYIGAGPHGAACPDCGSTCVSPVGELRITDNDYWSVANGTGELRIHTVDEHERSFEFRIGFQKQRNTHHDHDRRDIGAGETLFGSVADSRATQRVT